MPAQLKILSHPTASAHPESCSFHRVAMAGALLGWYGYVLIFALSFLIRWQPDYFPKAFSRDGEILDISLPSELMMSTWPSQVSLEAFHLPASQKASDSVDL